MDSKVNRAALRLFNAVPVERKAKANWTRAWAPAVGVKSQVERGFLFAPEIVPSVELMADVESVIGISGEKANASFHKSWAVVRDASMAQLVIQQMIHYMTTYGYARMGVYSEDTIYIPLEDLDLPEVKSIPLVIIYGLTWDELLERVIELDGSGIALSEETIGDIVMLVTAHDFDPAYVKGLQNRELRTALSDWYGMVPSEPVAFLRYVVSKLTDVTVLVKSPGVIAKIKAANGKHLDELLEDAPADLASIFYRYKPIFLALKSISKRKRGFFNRLRKDAPKMHRPVFDYLGSVTGQIKAGTLDLGVLTERLGQTSVWRKIRLLYALRYRIDPCGSIVYQVRNGKGYATAFDWSANPTLLLAAYERVMVSLCVGLSDKLEGKKIYIPDTVSYALPRSEKMFMGNIPCGSYVAADRDMVVGIYWEDVDGRRVDLDFSLLGVSGKVGWDGSYRTADRKILFSGDMTSAPRGASELCYCRPGLNGAHLAMVNYYNMHQGDEVDCKVFAARERIRDMHSQYMVNVNNLLATAVHHIDRKQNVIGLLAGVDGEMRFYFSNMSVGKNISSSNDVNAVHTRAFLAASMINSVDLRTVLYLSGMELVDEPTEGCVDLSVENLDKASILGLFV